MNLKNIIIPDFLCIGAQKSCTTWLNKVLKSDNNGNFFIPYTKESFFFNIIEGDNTTYPKGTDLRRMLRSDIFRKIGNILDNAAESKDKLTNKLDYYEYLGKSLELAAKDINVNWYNHLYSLKKPNQISGDITPDYSFLKEESIKTISGLKKDLKVILITRNKLERDLSQLKMQLLPRISNPDVEQCISFLKQPHCEERSKYSQIKNKWVKYVGEDNFLTLSQTKIKDNPAIIMDRITSFFNCKSIDVNPSILSQKQNVSTANDWVVPPDVHKYLEEKYTSKSNI